MKSQNILDLLNEALDTRYVTRKLNIISDQSNVNYSVGRNITVIASKIQ